MTIIPTLRYRDPRAAIEFLELAPTEELGALSDASERQLRLGGAAEGPSGAAARKAETPASVELVSLTLTNSTLGVIWPSRDLPRPFDPFPPSRS